MHEMKIKAGIIINDEKRAEMLELIKEVTAKVGENAVLSIVEENFSDEFDFEGDITNTEYKKMCLLMHSTLTTLVSAIE